MNKLVASFFSFTALLAVSTSLYATGTDTWTGLGADNNWSTAANWTGSNAPPVTGPGIGDNIVFDGNLRTTNNNDLLVNAGISSLTFAATAASFDLQGNGILFDFTQPGNSTLENDSANVQTLDFNNNAGFDTNAGFAIDGVHAFVNAAAGNIVINSNVELTNFAAGTATLLTFEGPGTTTVNGLIYESSFSVGSSGIEIAGPGTTIITNNGNLYTGGTIVNGGTLVVGGSFVLGDIGPLNDLTINGGQVMTPLNTPNFYRVYNNLNANGGTLFIQTGSSVTNSAPGTSNNDFLDVLASANLDINNSHLFVHQIAGFAPNNGDRITVISTATGVNGNFSDAPDGTVAPNDFIGLIQPFAEYTANTVDLQFGFAATFASVAKTPNQFAVGTALDEALAAGSLVNATNLIGNLPINVLRHTYGSGSSPEELASMYEASFGQGMVTSMNLQRRMDDIRAGATGFCNEGFTIQDNHGYSKNDDKSVASKDVVQQPAPPADTRWGSFITGSGELTKTGQEDDNARGYQLNQAGFTMGVDYRVTDNFAIGLTGGYTHTHGDLVDDGRLNTDGGRGGIYATYYTSGFYVDAAANGGYNQYDTRRTAFLGQENGSTDGAEFNGTVAAGYD